LLQYREGCSWVCNFKPILFLERHLAVNYCGVVIET
jgi:hypothetical protein